MQRIKEAGHVGNKFSKGVPGVSPATVLGEDWPNDVQEEIVKVIEDRGIALADATPSQLAAALALIAEGYGAPLYENLVITPNGANPLFQIDIDADFIKVEGWKFSAVNLTVDLSLAAQSVNGPETAEAASKWYHVWAIVDITVPAAPVIASYLSLRWPGGAGAEAPSGMTLPAGYTLKRYVGAAYNNSSSNIVDFHQVDRHVSSVRTTVVTGSSVTVYTAYTASAQVPQTAKEILGSLRSHDTGTLASNSYIASDANGLGEQHVSRPGGVTGFDPVNGPYSIPVVETQKLYYKAAGSTPRVAVEISGWEY